jgi:hypothetical protein
MDRNGCGYYEGIREGEHADYDNERRRQTSLPHNPAAIAAERFREILEQLGHVADGIEEGLDELTDAARFTVFPIQLAVKGLFMVVVASCLFAVNLVRAAIAGILLLMAIACS